MIGRIAGRLLLKASDHVLIDVGGVGYLVHVSDRTLAGLPAPGEAVALYTDLLVREDLLQLYGFATLIEKEWHRLLMSVQGIGAKASLAILGSLGAEGLSRAIALGDMAAIRAAKGVGPKTAQRVVNELKEKAPVVMAMGDDGGLAAPAPIAGEAGAKTASRARSPASPQSPGQPAAGDAGRTAAAQAEALSALQNLGYAPGEAAAAVAEVMGADEGGGLDTPALIRAALKLLAPKG